MLRPQISQTRQMADDHGQPPCTRPHKPSRSRLKLPTFSHGQKTNRKAGSALVPRFTQRGFRGVNPAKYREPGGLPAPGPVIAPDPILDQSTASSQDDAMRRVETRERAFDARMSNNCNALTRSLTQSPARGRMYERNVDPTHRPPRRASPTWYSQTSADLVEHIEHIDP